MSNPEANGNGRLSPEQVEALLREELPALKIEQGKVKLREWEALEDAADRPVTPWIGVSLMPMWFIRGELWLALRRKHPTLAYEDLADLDGDLLQEMIGLTRQKGEESDPTPPGGEAKPKPSRASATSGE